VLVWHEQELPEAEASLPRHIATRETAAGEHSPAAIAE